MIWTQTVQYCIFRGCEYPFIPPYQSNSYFRTAWYERFLFSQGVGGTVQYPKGYLKKAFEMVRERGGVCISDEVQAGFGRTGTHYWGFEGHDIMPDIGKCSILKIPISVSKFTL